MRHVPEGIRESLWMFALALVLSLFAYESRSMLALGLALYVYYEAGYHLYEYLKGYSK
jgi:hypothetical protein